MAECEEWHQCMQLVGGHLDGPLNTQCWIGKVWGIGEGHECVTSLILTIVNPKKNNLTTCLRISSTLSSSSAVQF